MRRKIYIIGVSILALLILGSFGVSLGVQPLMAQEQPTTTTVERRTLTNTVETSGSIEAESSVSLSFGTSGTVAEVLVEVGDAVTEGQVLASLNKSDLEYQIALDEQNLLTQQLNYDDLVAAATANDIAQARSTLSSAQSQLTRAQTNLENVVNDNTINCTDLNSATDALADAQDAYNDYVAAGYEWDADFIPDPDSEAGQRLSDAQETYDLEAAQCDNTTSLSEYEAEVAAAQASVDAAQANLDDLLNGSSDNDLALAQAKLDEAQLRLDNSRATLADAEIVAPFDGVIAEINIAAGAMTTSNSAAISMVDVSRLHIDVAVDEEDIPQIQLGQNARISPSALDGTSVTGTVTRIAPVGTNEDGIITYDVRIDIDANASLPLYVGMTTDVEVVVGQEDAVLVVPTEAIQRDGTTVFVEILNVDGSSNRVNVSTGLTTDGVTVIAGDISEGVTVVVPVREVNADSGNNPFGGGD
jgi:HlyD family secretion protein